MSPGRKRVCQLLALLLTFAIMQVYVLALPANSSAPATPNDTTASSTDTELFGLLTTFGSGRIVLNGNEVESGMTVLSDSQIQTPDNAAATVSLASAGKVDIAPKSNVTLTFARNSVTVKVKSGDALLTTNEGVKGVLVTSDARMQTTDGHNGASVGTALYADEDTNSQGGPSRHCRIAGMRCALFWTLVATGTGLALYFWLRGDNPSEHS